MPIYEFEGVRPFIDPEAYVHPDATLIGDVLVFANAYIGPQAALRGDYGRLIVREGANVQDGCIMHGYAGVDTEVGPDSSIGHGAVLHGCRIGRGSLIGMRAVVMDDAVIGPESIVAAMSFVPAGYVGSPRELLKGIPARHTRVLSDEELRWNRLNIEEYQHLARRSKDRLLPCAPLRSVPDQRAYLQGTTEVRPLHLLKQPTG